MQYLQDSFSTGEQPPEDPAILQLLEQRDENAIRAISEKYGRYCRSIAVALVGEQEADQILNDTWMKIWCSVPPYKPLSLKGYAGTVTRQLSLNALKSDAAQKRGSGRVAPVLEELGDCLQDSTDLCERVALRDALERFLSELPPITRKIFLQRYFYLCTVREISASCAIKESTVTMQLTRTRKKLHKYLIKEGFTL